MALEDGEDMDEYAADQIENQERRPERQMTRDSAPSNSASPAPETKKGKKVRGRPKVESEAGPSSKRKRGKAVSPTPSADEEIDGRDQKRRKVQPVGGTLSASARERMKKAFDRCYKAVQNLYDEDGRQRCVLFKDLPNKTEYPDYYQLIKTPIAMSHLRKRASTNYYKTVLAYRDEWRLMFNNARTYNQEGSWVYVDANEMQKVLEAVFRKEFVGTDLPGADAIDSDNGAGFVGRSESNAPKPAPKLYNKKSIESDEDDFVSSDEDD